MTNQARWMLLLLEAALVPAALLLGWLLGYPPLDRFAWRADGLAWGMAAALPMLIALGVSTAWRPKILEPLFDVVDDFLVPLFRQWTLAELALVSALAGIGEEMLFRGVLQPAVTAYLGTAAGIAIVGLIFGAVHAVNAIYFLFAAVVGCYLGLLVVATDNLLTAMVRTVFTILRPWYTWLACEHRSPDLAATLPP